MSDTLFDFLKHEDNRIARRRVEKVRTILDAPRPTARNSDPETSHQAAAKVAVKADTHRAKALLALNRAGSAGLNDFELADETGLAQTSVGVRRKELVSLGFVERAPLHPRPSPSGSPSIVWRVTAAGRDAAAALIGT